MTPLEKLASLPNVDDFLRKDITIDQLKQRAQPDGCRSRPSGSPGAGTSDEQGCRPNPATVPRCMEPGWCTHRIAREGEAATGYALHGCPSQPRPPIP